MGGWLVGWVWGWGGELGREGTRGLLNNGLPYLRPRKPTLSFLLPRALVAATRPPSATPDPTAQTPPPAPAPRPPEPILLGSLPRSANAALYSSHPRPPISSWSLCPAAQLTVLHSHHPTLIHRYPPDAHPDRPNPPPNDHRDARALTASRGGVDRTKARGRIAVCVSTPPSRFRACVYWGGCV